MTSAETFDAQTARSYVLVGFIFYILGAAGSVMGFLFSSIFMGSFMGPDMMGSGMMGGFPWAVGFPSVFFIISAAFTVWAWITLSNINAGRYQNAQTASLILGIFGLFFAWLIGGIFFLLAYGKLGDVLRYRQISSQKTTPQPPAPAETISAETSRFCSQCGKAVSEEDEFCKYCGNHLK